MYSSNFTGMRSEKMKSKVLAKKKELPFKFSIAIAIPLAIPAFLLMFSPTHAHHAMGVQVSSNFLEGFLSGLAHPIIGIDHLAFIVAIGFLSAVTNNGRWLPVTFLLASLSGTGIHLLSFDLPASELFIAASVVLAGSILAMKDKPYLSIMILMAAISGLFHGYAYGEAIIGATTVPLVAYLLGFTLIQWTIAIAASKVGQSTRQQGSDQSNPLRFVGVAVLSAGVLLLTTQLLG
jgi:urease accessory protein